MYSFKRILLGLSMLLLGNVVFAQETTTEANDIMKSNGKIYVVMIVVILIVLGLFAYVFNLDRKVSKLEKGNE